PCGKEGVSLQFNDGTGWQWLYQGELAAGLKLTGFEGGPLVLTGVVGEDQGIFLFDEGELTLSRRTESFPEVFVAGSELAYAVVNDELLEYRGSTWESLTALPMTGTA